MTSAFEREIEEQANALTTCSICTDVFTNPKVLPCQHTFCLTCLQKHHDATNSQRLVPVSSFACPTCRKVCYVPRHSLDQLPTDFKVDQIRDLVKIISRSKPSAKEAEEVRGGGKSQGALADCVVCRSTRGLLMAAEVFCVQCARSFCKACAVHHSGTPVFQNHTVVPARAAASSSAGAWKCALHDHEVQYFCDRCVAPACTICVLSIHEKHPVSDQKTAASRFYDQLTRSCDELCQKKEDLQTQLGALNRLRQEHGRCLQESERSVLGASREAYRTIRELEEQTLADVRSCSKEKLDRIGSVEKELSTRMESLTALCQSLTEVLSYANPKAFFDSYSQLAVKAQGEMGEEGPDVGTAQLRSVSTFVPRVQVKLGEMEKKSLAVEEELTRAPLTTGTRVESPRTTPETESPLGGKKESATTGSGRQALQRRRSEVGSRTSSPVPEPSRGRRTDFLNTLERRLNSKPSNNNNNNNNNNSSDGISLAVSQTDAKNNNVGNKFNNKKTETNNSSNNNNNNVTRQRERHSVTQNPEAVRLTRSATFSSEGDLMMRSRGDANSTSTSSSLTNLSRTRQLWISTKFSNCRDCCFVSGCQVAATDCSVVGGRIKMLAGIGGDLVDVVDSCLIVQPWGICYNSSTGYMLLTDHGGSPSLKTVRVGSTRDVRVYRCPVDRPSGVAVTRSGDIVVSDTGSRRHKIGIFSNANLRMTKIREFGCHGDGEGEVLRANYVTVDHSDRVIVSDADSHTVKVFGLTGQQLLRFSSSGSDGAEMSPQGLAVDDANNIFVADQATQAVVKYSPHGQLIETVAQTVGVPWGISICWEEGLLAAATSRGLELFKL